VHQVNVARDRHKIARDEAEAANFGLSASAADEKECLLELEKANLEADRVAIERRIKQGRELLDAADEALSAVAGGPKTMAAYLGEKTESAAKTVFIEIVYTTERNQLIEIASKIEAIDKALKENKCQAHKDRLAEARAKLQGKTKDLMLQFRKIVEHRVNAWSIIDQLAALEKAKRTSTFFQHLQTYNKQVNKMGATVFDSVAAYQDFLLRPPVSRGDFIYDIVQDDIAKVEAEDRDKSGQWTEVAKNLRSYLNEYSRWHHAERKRTAKILEDLRAGKHLHFVDTMVAEAAKDLGATVDRQDIIQ
jgi:hypothetical protein